MNEKESERLKAAKIGILLFGIVSLLGDIVYEGARGIVPSYLEFLGASAVLVGLVGGFGDFLGYALRLLSGFLADSTRAYWTFIFIGYGLIGAIPFLGIPLGLEIAIVLVLTERVGKAFRSPSRDTVLSFISKGVGAGKAFGIHELLDQIGAIIGPLIVTVIIGVTGNNYNMSLGFLAIPFLMLIVVLTCTYKRVGPTIFIPEKPKAARERYKLGKSFYIYSLAVFLNTAGLIPASLILFKATEIFKPTGMLWVVPLVYLIIQCVDAPVALISGILYDKFGRKVLFSSFVLSLFPALLVMIETQVISLFGAAIFFGVVLGMQESIYRAAVADLTPISSRGLAYGIFNTVYGVGFVLSGLVYGTFTDLRAPFIWSLVFVVVIQCFAMLFLARSFSSIRQSTSEIASASAR
ncbi:MAG: MFS transporter [Candidatus Sigynarchaeota archaeon]